MKRNAIAPWSRRLTALLLVLFAVLMSPHRRKRKKEDKP